MTGRATRLAALAVVVISAATTCGDGKFFLPERVPAGVPYQRAFLLFHNDWETLILQSKYEIPETAETGNLGWVVPVPAVPELTSMNAPTTGYFFKELSFATQSQPLHLSAYFGVGAVVLFLGALAFLLVTLLEYPFLPRMKLTEPAW